MLNHRYLRAQQKIFKTPTYKGEPLLPDVNTQILAAQDATSLEEGLRLMNADVTPCPKKKALGFFPLSSHTLVDYTHRFQGKTCKRLYRCADCGLFIIKSST